MVTAESTTESLTVPPANPQRPYGERQAAGAQIRSPLVDKVHQSKIFARPLESLRSLPMTVCFAEARAAVAGDASVGTACERGGGEGVEWWAVMPMYHPRFILLFSKPSCFMCTLSRSKRTC